MKYKGELFAKLKEGKIEHLYFQDKEGNYNKKKPRHFYKKGSKWFFDDEEIIAFTNKNDENIH